MAGHSKWSDIKREHTSEQADIIKKKMEVLMEQNAWIENYVTSRVARLKWRPGIENCIQGMTNQFRSVRE